MIGCASIGRPGGGPKDVEAPVMISSSPANNSLFVDINSNLEIEFSEIIDPQSFRDALFIAPEPKEKPKITWRGKSVTIKFKDALKPDQMVVVTIGTNLKDTHNNKMEESAVIAFSTGSHLEMGQILGQVFQPDKNVSFLIGAWRFSEDTLMNPSEAISPYTTQPDKSDKFNVPHLKPGVYRVMGWEDHNKDKIYDPSQDKLAIASHDIVLYRDSIRTVNLYPVKRDTGKVQVLFASALDNRHLMIRYNRTPQKDQRSIIADAKIASSTGKLELMESWYDPSDSNRVYFQTSIQDSSQEYKLEFKSDTTSNLFRGSARPDTTGPRISGFSPKKGSSDLLSKPFGFLAFDEPIVVNDSSGLFQIIHSDSIEIEVDIMRIDANKIYWQSVDTISEGINCRFNAELWKIEDKFGNPSLDSTWLNNFTTLDAAKLGSISGSINQTMTVPVVVCARQIESRGKKEIKASIDSDGSFTLSNLAEGSYLLWAFEDLDKDSVYNFGNLDPFKFSENFVFYSDTVKVRMRWETSGIKINFLKK